MTPPVGETARVLQVLRTFLEGVTIEIPGLSLQAIVMDGWPGIEAVWVREEPWKTVYARCVAGVGAFPNGYLESLARNAIYGCLAEGYRFPAELQGETEESPPGGI